MKWYCFDLAGLPEVLHTSMTSAFARLAAADQQEPDSTAVLYASRPTPGDQPSMYFLGVSDEQPYLVLIRQFGGLRCSQPSNAGLMDLGGRKESSQFPTAA